MNLHTSQGHNEFHGPWSGIPEILDSRSQPYVFQGQENQAWFASLFQEQVKTDMKVNSEWEKGT